MARYYRTERVGFRFPAHPHSRCLVSGGGGRSARSWHRPDTQHLAPDTLGGGGGGGQGVYSPLLQQRLDQLGEAVARPVEAALDRPQVAPLVVGDLSVALPFQLP